METTAVAAPPARGRFHVDPALTAAAVGGSLALGGAILWRLLVYGLGMEVTDWRLLGCVGIDLVTLLLLWSERRRILSHPLREAGADEASWKVAAFDSDMRRRLEHPVSLVLVATFVVLVPWTVWLAAEPFSMIVAFYVAGVFVLLADLVARRHAESEGRMDTFEGSQAPPGWWALGALAVALPLVWLPVGLMAAAAGPAVLVILAIAALNGAGWWVAGTGWQRRWSVDRGLRGIPLEWHWRQRSALLGLFVRTAIWMALLLTLHLDDQISVSGSSCLGGLLWFFWWPVTYGLLFTGVTLREREVGPPPAVTEQALPNDDDREIGGGTR